MCLGPDEQPFLDAVRDRPRDDEPRLVYADYLERSADPATAARGELVRVQCALARLGRDHPARPALAGREHDILRDHLPEWVAALPGRVTGLEFRRGLPDAVAVDAGHFVAAGAALLDRLPVRRVRLLDTHRAMPWLVDCPALARVRELDLSNNDLGGGGVYALLRSPHLRAVERLDLGFNWLDDAAVGVFGRAALPALRGLALNNCGLGTGGARTLAAAPGLVRLRSLDLSENGVDGDGVRAVVGAFPFLTALGLDGNPVGDDGAAALAGSPVLHRMLARGGRLDLRRTGIGPAGAAALARSPHMGRATDLELAGNAVGDAGLAELAGSPHLGRLRSLGVGQNRVGDAGAVALARSRLVARLARLDVSHNRLTVRGVRALWAARPAGRAGVDVTGNLHPGGWPGGDAAAPVGPDVDAIVRALDATADLRRRIAHPARRG